MRRQTTPRDRPVARRRGSPRPTSAPASPPDPVESQTTLEPLLPESYRRVFALTRRAAVSVLKRRLRALALLRDALLVMTRHPDSFSDTREDTTRLIRLVYAWNRGSYRAIPWRSLVMIVAALVYLVVPLDAIFDGLPVIGLADDTTILGAVAHSLRGELDRFRRWERQIPEAGSPS